MPDCSLVANCSQKGICIAQSQCMCLPSWEGDNCNKKIIDFFPLLKTESFFRSIGILEFIILFHIVSHFILRKLYGKFYFASYDSSLMDGRYYTLILAAFNSKNVLHFVNNLYGFYVYAPILYQLIGSSSFLWFFFSAIIFCNIFSIFLKKLQKTSTFTIGSSGFLIAIKMLLILLSQGDVLKNSIQLILSHLLVDYVFIGDELDLIQMASGFIYSLGYFQMILHE